MRALLPLLVAAVTAAVTAASSAAAPPPPALLVLRAACSARDPAAFAPPAVPSARSIRVLSYEETCGAGWRTAVARAGLRALSRGAAVGLAGWPGAAVCAALGAAARALGAARPVECGRGAARGAVVARLVAAAGWRRAALVPAPPRSECHAALREVAAALVAARTSLLTVDLAPLFSDDLALLSHVVIVCAPRVAGADDERGAALAAAAGAVLVLHVDEALSDDVESPAPAVAPPTIVDDDFRSNNEFSANRVSYLKKKFRKEKKLSVRADAFFERPLRSIHSFRVESSKINKASALRRATDFETSLGSKRHANDLRDSKQTNENQHRRKLDSNPVSNRFLRPNSVFSYVNTIFPRGNLLLLSDDRLGEGRDTADLRRTYAEALEAVEKATRAENARIEVAEFTFQIFRRRALESRSALNWGHFGSVATRSTRILDDTSEWVTDVRPANGSDVFYLLREAQFQEGGEATKDEDRSSGAGAGAGADAGAGAGAGTGTGAATLSAGAGVVLAAAGALALRWAAARRRRRRRGGDAVLAPADFSFPADDRRCVGEGMETMLSCWLQQLHEFGGPELERPDLLKQPPRPSAPSAPSSTCSVNRIALDRRVRYKGDAVHLKPLETGPTLTEATRPATGSGAAAERGGSEGDAGALDFKRKEIDVLLLMKNLRHENLNPFIGALCQVRPALVWELCGRGSLEDVLVADDIELDWTFRLSLLTDLVRGMRYLHASPLRVHGRLTSRNCVVDSRWVLRLTDYGLPALRRAHGCPSPAPPARLLLWTAPELLRDAAARARGSQPGDVYSFAIIMQEVIVRGEPFCMLALTPDEIVEKLRRPPPLIRPSVSMGAAPPEAVSVMRQCWSEAPDLRPDFHRLDDLFRHLHRGRKVNIVDSMFEMLEKYSNNLEELIKERTDQLDMEKKKTEQLLNRMLPRSVAERLMTGARVEPEEFSEVSIYFSDIVGFTALAARSTPVQVVDLLNDLYTTFDAAIERYRVYKVETIGDAYMVVGGLPARAVDHAESVATMALHLLHLAGRFRVRHLPDTPLRLRIGLHSGPCCAAVVGLTMPRYCLFGDTVNTASRMESTGAAWRIQVSAATADRLVAAGGFRLRSRGLVAIKGKGVMHTYWLLGKDGFDKSLPTPPPLQSEEVLFETDAENESEAASGPALPPTPAPAPAPTSAVGPQLAAAPAPELLPASSSFEMYRSPDGATDNIQKGRERSGAVSADSSPRAAGAGARYRRAASSASAGRALRRQWSLERGEALAVAAAEGQREAGEAQVPLALLAAAAPAGARAAAARYRTRTEPPAEPPPPPP